MRGFPSGPRARSVIAQVTEARLPDAEPKDARLEWAWVSLSAHGWRPESLPSPCAFEPWTRTASGDGAHAAYLQGPARARLRPRNVRASSRRDAGIGRRRATMRKDTNHERAFRQRKSGSRLWEGRQQIDGRTVRCTAGRGRRQAGCARRYARSRAAARSRTNGGPPASGWTPGSRRASGSTCAADRHAAMRPWSRTASGRASAGCRSRSYRLRTSAR